MCQDVLQVILLVEENRAVVVMLDLNAQKILSSAWRLEAIRQLEAPLCLGNHSTSLGRMQEVVDVGKQELATSICVSAAVQAGIGYTPFETESKEAGPEMLSPCSTSLLEPVKCLLEFENRARRLLILDALATACRSPRLGHRGDKPCRRQFAQERSPPWPL
jgi:hypothetical protein